MGGRTLPREIVILRNAKKYLKKGRCRDAWSRDSKGRDLGTWNDPKARSWCPGGAIRKAAEDAKETYHSTENLVQRTLRKKKACTAFMIWADDPERTDKEIEDLIDEAIEEAERDAKRILSRPQKGETSA